MLHTYIQLFIVFPGIYKIAWGDYIVYEFIAKIIIQSRWKILSDFFFRGGK